MIGVKWVFAIEAGDLLVSVKKQRSEMVVNGFVSFFQ